MRKSLGSKRQEIGEDDVKLITKTFGNFEAIKSYRLDKEPEEKSNRGRQSSSKKKAEKKTFGSKIFESHEFGYRRITIERPLRLSVQFTDERVATLRFVSGKLNAAMQKVYEQFIEPTALAAGKKVSGTALARILHTWIIDLQVGKILGLWQPLVFFLGCRGVRPPFPQTKSRLEVSDFQLVSVVIRCDKVESSLD